MIPVLIYDSHLIYDYDDVIYSLSYDDLNEYIFLLEF